MEFSKNKIFIAVGILLFLAGANNVKAANVGDIVNFNVDKSFDASSRTQISAYLVRTEPGLYFYIDKHVHVQIVPDLLLILEIV